MEDAVKLSTYPEFKIEFNTLSSMSITSRKISCQKEKKKKKKGTSTFQERVIQLFDSNYSLLLLSLQVGETEFWWAWRENSRGPPISLPLPLSTKHHSCSFSLLFSILFFPSSLKSSLLNIPLNLYHNFPFFFFLISFGKIQIFNFIYLLDFVSFMVGVNCIICIQTFLLFIFT